MSCLVCLSVCVWADCLRGSASKSIFCRALPSSRGRFRCWRLDSQLRRGAADISRRPMLARFLSSGVWPRSAAAASGSFLQYFHYVTFISSESHTSRGFRRTDGRGGGSALLDGVFFSSFATRESLFSATSFVRTLLSAASAAAPSYVACNAGSAAACKLHGPR